MVKLGDRVNPPSSCRTLVEHLVGCYQTVNGYLKFSG
jgi:hypothetical protein